MVYLMTFNLAAQPLNALRVTVLLEYPDLAMDIHSWISLTGFNSDSSLLLQVLSMMTIPITDWFSVHFSRWLRYNWADLYSQIWLHNFDTDWVLCHISVVFFPIPFKPQKCTSTMIISYTGQIPTNSFQ